VSDVLKSRRSVGDGEHQHEGDSEQRVHAKSFRVTASDAIGRILGSERGPGYVRRRLTAHIRWLASDGCAFLSAGGLEPDGWSPFCV
jgi:hypothetical protein